jgi:hypothetical protein
MWRESLGRVTFLTSREGFCKETVISNTECCKNSRAEMYLLDLMTLKILYHASKSQKEI